MTEVARLERCNTICGTFYRVIEKYAQESFSCVVDIDALANIVGSLTWPIGVFDGAKFANPYYFSFYDLISRLMDYQESMGIAEPIDFVFDNQNEKTAILNGWDLYRASAPLTVHKLLGAIPRFEDDEQFLPLQAADMLAWWCRRWENELGPDPINRIRKFPWKATKEMHHLQFTFYEHDIREHFNELLGNKNVLWFTQQSKDVLQQLADARSYLATEIEDNRPSFFTRLRQWIRAGGTPKV